MMPATHPGLPEIATPLTVDLHNQSPDATRQAIRDYFHQTFDAYERLFEPLRGQEAFVRRADPLRHPLIFYYGHTAVFFINKLVLGKFLPSRIDPALERQCAIGVDEMSWDDLNSAHYEWPDHLTVKAYRDKVRNAVDELIASAPLTTPVSWQSPLWVVMMGIEHERIHLETSSVLIRQLPLELLDPEDQAWCIFDGDHPVAENRLLEVPGGRVRQGKTGDSPFYGWDNEYGSLESDVQPFQASAFLVSNGEFKAFVDARGYSTQRFWSDEGWEWCQYENRGMPRFWRRHENGSYSLRCMLKEIPMPWSWPVEVNFLEAKAFCNWKAEETNRPVRLPTEAEWYRLADHAKAPNVDEWNGAPGNINLEVAASPTPVDMFAFEHGFHDVLGNVWQHTETPIAALPGFAVHPLYDDFSTPTFDTKHNLIKGGSWISTGNECLLESRYAFRRHFYQHAGFRYIESDAPVVINDDRYETDPDVVPWCESQYGPQNDDTANYSEALAQFCLDSTVNRSRRRALELGCKVGRTTFELAAGFDEVVGIDPTARTIRIGVELQEKGYTQWEIPSEGEIVDFRQAHLSSLGLDDFRRRVSFAQADLSNMKEIHTAFDLIVVNGLLERTYHPERFLQTVHKRLNAGGLLIIASSSDWRKEFTEPKHWLGGYKDESGENVRTIDTLHRILNPHFIQLQATRQLESSIIYSARRRETLLVDVSAWELRQN